MKPMTDQPKDPESKPSHDEVAKKAYAIYQKEGSPQGHARQNWSEAEDQMHHHGSGTPDHHDYHDHHAHMRRISGNDSGSH